MTFEESSNSGAHLTKSVLPMELFKIHVPYENAEKIEIDIINSLHFMILQRLNETLKNC